jgi:4-carboxymuconolactone decarboxylase
MTDERYERGMAVRRAVLGEEHVERAQAGTTEFTRDFQELITRYAWGEIWTRPGLDRKTRSLLTIAILAALGRSEELRLHVRATRNTGATRDEVREVLMQVAVYAGVPAGNSAFAHAAGVYRELDDEATS